jgi:hypothetical protein
LAAGVAPNSIAPATAPAPIAPTARRRAEDIEVDSEIDILVAPSSSGSSGGLTPRTLNPNP